MQGFAPADEILLFRQKDPKPFPPVRSPLGPSATVPNQDGSGTRGVNPELAEGLKQPSPRGRFGTEAPLLTKAGRYSRNKSSWQT